MRIEFVNRNQTGFEHYHITPTIELIGEATEISYVIGDDVEYDWEYSLGLSWLNLSIWLVW